MKSPRLVFGLYEARPLDGDPSTCARLRELSLSWARFGYQGPVIEGTDAGPILDEALERGYEYCLVFASGTMFDENWYPAHWGHRDVHRSLGELMDDGDFLAAGRPPEGSGGSITIDERCLLVNLRRYAAAGRPVLAAAALAMDEAGSNQRPAGSANLRGSCVMPRPAHGATIRDFDPTTTLAAG